MLQHDAHPLEVQAHDAQDDRREDFPADPAPSTEIRDGSGDAASVAPLPRTVEETGLGERLLADLVLKHLLDGGVLTLATLARRMALCGAVIEEVMTALRRDARVEVRARQEAQAALPFALTERGRAGALEASMRSGYLGPAPVPLEHYTDVVRAQSVRRGHVRRARMHELFADLVIDPALLDQLGPAMNSGRALFVYGAAGTGKSFVTTRLARLLDGPVLVPHALAVGDTVIELLDPALHETLAEREPALWLEGGLDARFSLCRRPVVHVGGELTADMLEVQYEAESRRYRAPLQLQASNGMLIIDDLGRQRAEPKDVLNRWIVPMEEGRDHLALGTGQHFTVPFDLVLVFSTNLHPRSLADEAFLRRLGYKIRFDALQPQAYQAIWSQVCEERGLDFDASLCRFVVDELHTAQAVPLLPCHPRDLIGMALDRSNYLDGDAALTAEALHWAWSNYFVDSQGAA